MGMAHQRPIWAVLAGQLCEQVAQAPISPTRLGLPSSLHSHLWHMGEKFPYVRLKEKEKSLSLFMVGRTVVATWKGAAATFYMHYSYTQNWLWKTVVRQYFPECLTCCCSHSSAHLEAKQPKARIPRNPWAVVNGWSGPYWWGLPTWGIDIWEGLAFRKRRLNIYQ